MSWSDKAKAYAAAITAAERPIGNGKVKAFHDPQKAANNRPSVLIALPVAEWTQTFDGGYSDLTWQLIALASKDTNGLAAFHELEALVDAVDHVLDITTARPATYALGNARVPCYVLTVPDQEIPT